jgi:hypothetical protein
MDAGGAPDERARNGLRQQLRQTGTGSVDGCWHKVSADAEVVWSWPPDAEAKLREASFAQ